MSKSAKDAVILCVVLGFLAFAFTAYFLLVITFCNADSNGVCTSCENEITDSADYVCRSDGTRLHAECYLAQIEKKEEK